jgi:acetyltransferase-like isoleucine patch superfamily enzyme
MSSAAPKRQVAATFGRRDVPVQPVWEKEFSAALRSSYSLQELLELFGRFRAGENAFDRSMRRVLMLAMCKSAGNELQVEPNVTLKHPETFELGDCVFIGAQTMIQGRFDGVCKIGSHVWIGPQSYFDARDLVLDDYVGWGPGAKVLGSAHTGVPTNEPIIRTDIVIRPVRVGFGADIGMNASLMPGVRIGAHSIIGAGAVVTHDIPDYAIAAGVPARVIKDRRT